jgi:triosephosphate isomerase
MIVSNWKMNGSKESVEKWLNEVSQNIQPRENNPCIFCPPACYLDLSRKIIDENSSLIKLGSQIIESSTQNALTGGISSQMLKDYSTDYVLIGHSEQRQHYKEDNISLRLKLNSAIQSQISVIFCLGEPEEIKNNNQTQEFLIDQLELLEEEDFGLLTLAYEPIWAIGTGLKAENKYIDNIHGFLKNYCQTRFDLKQNVSVVYGGSVKLENCEEILSSDNVDGLLIGGASLDPDTFSKIYNLS